MPGEGRAAALGDGSSGEHEEEEDGGEEDEGPHGVFPIRLLEREMLESSRAKKIKLKRLRRRSMLIFETFFYGLNVLNVVALDGLHRTLRPYSSHRWQKMLSDASLCPFPRLHCVLEEACDFIEGLPTGFSIEIGLDVFRIKWQGSSFAHVSIVCS